MEVLWIFPLYILIPIISISLIIVGLFRIRKNSRSKTLYFGVGLLALPILHMLLMASSASGLEDSVVGTYKLKNQSEVLMINEDGTFIFNRTKTDAYSGTGHWKIERIDFDILMMNYDTGVSSQLWLKISDNHERILLTSMEDEDSMALEFIKKRQH